MAPGELLLPLAFALAGTLLVWIVARVLLGSAARAGIVASACVLLFSLYGSLVTALGPGPGRNLTVFGAELLLIALVVWRVARTRSGSRGITVFFNSISAAMLVTIIVSGLPALLKPGAVSRSTGTRSRIAGGGPGVPGPAGRPDVYYIILDGHARADVLKQTYGYDDSDFIDFLTRNGFYVVKQSRSNYAQTYLSLSSSLNMTYLDSLAAGHRSSGRPVAAIHGRRKSAGGIPEYGSVLGMIGHSRVAEFFRAHGYRIVSFASGYTGTDLEDADVHMGPRLALSEFQNLALATTPVPFLLELMTRKSQSELHREMVLYTLRHLPDAARSRRPVFVFAHIVCPHPPFVFGPHGEKLEPAGVFTLAEGGEFEGLDKRRVREDYVRGYRDQAAYLDGQVEAAVSRILSASPVPPVIILQGDHGPGSILNWDDPDWSEVPERFANLNAIRLPASDGRPATDSGFYDSETPVNSFRLVLSRLFDTLLSLLPDRSYFSTISQPYVFYDIDNPGSYPGTRSPGQAGGAIAVVAFPSSGHPPANPALYCRRLVTLEYRGRQRSVASFHVLPHAGMLAVDQAFALYRQSVAAGKLQDFGAGYEAYSGRGPDQDSVVALFFPVPDTPP